MVVPPNMCLWLTALSLCASCAGDLLAQNRPLERAERERKKILGDDSFGQGKDSVIDQRENEPAGDSSPLGVNFVSIELISHQDKATISAEPSGEGVLIDPRLPAPVGMQAALKPYLGREVSMALLGELGKDIVIAWRESDYPLVDVYFPEQNITQGRIQVVVREAVLGKRSVTGAVLTGEDYILQQFQLQAGDRVNSRRVEADLDWLNENPVRQVRVVYEKGEKDGTTDLGLEVEERKQVTSYAGFANTGLDSTGENEFSFGFNIGNPLGLEHAFGYNFGADEDFKFLQAHSVFYEAFLPWRHTLRFTGAHVSSEARNQGDLGVKGLSKQMTTAYRIPLGRPEFSRSWKHYFTLAFDYKSTDTDLIFGGDNLFTTELQVGQFRASYEFGVPDSHGFTRVTLGVVGSPGGMFGDNKDNNFMMARTGSTSDYWYGFGEFERSISLPRDFLLRLRASGKATTHRLASTEQILGGGYATVRGFDESIIRGDSGFLGTAELVSPPLDLFETLDDTFRFFAFIDTAAFDITSPLPGESSPALTGAGLGVTCRLGDSGFARASYGWALSDYGVSPSLVDPGKFHFGLSVTY